MGLDQLKRREVLTLISGAAAAWPLAARAQQGERMRRVGILITLSERDPEAQARLTAFREGLRKLGWTEGRNLRIEYRLSAGDAERGRAYAADLVAMTPDVIVAGNTTALIALREATRSVPMVFVQVTDPIGNGYVTSLSRPGGNITGFALYESVIGVKWLELLKEIAPRVARVAIVHDLTDFNTKLVKEVEAAAPKFGAQVFPLAIRDVTELERAIDGFASEPNGGLIPVPGDLVVMHRDLIIGLTVRYRLPNVYAFRYYPTGGGLASYGVDNVDTYRAAASYVDRILKGENPGDLPVQFSTKFELVINLKTARLLGVDPPIALLARTDEVIE
jgi:putative ABC transport system substrate-binding protein